MTMVDGVMQTARDKIWVHILFMDTYWEWLLNTELAQKNSR